MKKNVASQVIGAEMVSATDGSAFTGAVTAYVTGDGGTQAIGSVASGACAHEGNGFHTYAPAQAETNYDHVAFTFIGTGAVPATVQAYPSFPQTGDSFTRIGTTGSGLTSLASQSSVDAVDNFVDTEVADIQARLPAALVAGRMDVSVGAMAANVVTDAAVAADVTIASVTGAVGSVTAAVTVGTNNDKAGYGLSSAAVQAIWDALTSALTTVGSIGKKLADWVIGTTQTGDAFARLGAPAGASVSVDIASIKSETAAILADTDVIGSTGQGLTSLATQASVNTIDDFLDTEITAIKAVTDAHGATGTGLTAIPWNAAWDAEVQSEAADALVAFGPPTNAQMEARTPTAAQLAYIVSNAADGVPVTFSGGTTTTAVLVNVDGAAASSINDFYKGRILIFNAGTLAKQATDITAYNGTTKTATITAVTTAVTSAHAANMN